MNELGKKLNIRDYEGWYSVTTKMIEDYGGVGLLDKYNWSRKRLLQSVFPEYLNDQRKCRSF